jgi:hypothetical protein
MLIMSETVSLPREEYELMVQELESLRNTGLYKRLLEFEQNLDEGKVFTRKDLGF